MSNNSQIAFAPIGDTVAMAANTVAPLGIQAPVYPRFEAQNAGQYRFINLSSNVVFMGTGSTAAEAQANSVAPVAGTPSSAIVLVPGAVEVLRFSRTTYFSGLSAAASTVYIVPGQGL